jgi:hypothetical protein
MEILYIGGPYHGHRGSAASNSGGTEVSGPQGLQRYVPFRQVGSILLYRHNSISPSAVLSLLVGATRRGELPTSSRLLEGGALKLG